MLQIQVRVAPLFLVISLLLSCPIHAEEKGAEIYRAQCAACHGNNGEGNPEQFSDPLRGDLPLSELEDLIVKTMPDEHPELCIGNDAKFVEVDDFLSMSLLQDRLNQLGEKTSLKVDG